MNLKELGLTNYGQTAGIGEKGPGYVYDVEREDEPVSFPDVPQLLEDIISILEFINKPEMKELKQKNEPEFQLYMEQQFPDFSFRNYSLFLKLLSGEDITPLLGMLAAIEKIKSGQLTLEEAEKSVGEQLAQKYVYPQLKNAKKSK